MKENIVNQYHPELNSHNYDEITSYTKIVRDNYNASYGAWEEVILNTYSELNFLFLFFKYNFI